MLGELTALDVVFIALGAFGIGFSKAGFHGVSMLHVILYAIVFGSKQSTGTVLPMLVIGDLCAMYCLVRKRSGVTFANCFRPHSWA